MASMPSTLTQKVDFLLSRTVGLNDNCEQEVEDEEETHEEVDRDEGDRLDISSPVYRQLSYHQAQLCCTCGLQVDKFLACRAQKQRPQESKKQKQHDEHHSKVNQVIKSILERGGQQPDTGVDRRRKDKSQDYC